MEKEPVKEWRECVGLPVGREPVKECEWWEKVPVWENEPVGKGRPVGVGRSVGVVRSRATASMEVEIGGGGRLKLPVGLPVGRVKLPVGLPVGRLKEPVKEWWGRLEWVLLGMGMEREGVSSWATGAALMILV